MTDASKEGAARKPQGACPGLHILVVEDDMEFAEGLAQLLGSCGHNVEVALNGPSAIAAVQARAPDVVLLDLGLPEMSGYEVARQLQGQGTAKAPFVVALTGHGDENARRQAIEAGIDLHLVKPVDPMQLGALLQRFQQAVGE